jgi:excisionase family DNA binding protein
MSVSDDGFKLLTAAEVAELLSVPERWVRDASREGRLPVVKLGRYRRFRREAVLAWIEEREVEPRGRK